MIRKKNAFTLIELLVVISIIALLLSVLVPALSRAKDVAKKTVCQSQQKQWGTATMAYSIENNDAIPYFSTMGGYKNKSANNHLWFQKLAPYLSREARKDQYDEGYTTEVRKCPAGKRSDGDMFAPGIWDFTDGWVGWIGVHYGVPGIAPFYYSSQYVVDGGSENPEFRLSKVSRMSDCLLYMDVNTFYMYHPGGGGSGNFGCELDMDYDGDGKMDSSSRPYNQEKLPYNCARPKIHYGGCNVTLADGHVEYMKYEELWSTSQHENAGGRWEMDHQYWNPVP